MNRNIFNPVYTFHQVLEMKKQGFGLGGVDPDPDPTIDKNRIRLSSKPDRNRPSRKKNWIRPS